LPVTSKMPQIGPVSSYSLLAGLAGYMLAKKSGNGMLKNAGTAILISEAFAAGASANVLGSTTVQTSIPSSVYN